MPYAGPALVMSEVFGRTGPPTFCLGGGARFWTLKIPYKLIRNAATRCVLRAYNAAKQNATAAGAPLRTPLGELTALHKTP